MSLSLAIKNRLGPRRDMSTVLWRRGGLVGVFLLTMYVGNCFVSHDRAVTSDMLGHDFLAFYYGGYCARTNHYEQLYDLPATKKFEYQTGHAAELSLGTSFGPWWNPPFAAWLFAPFSALPYLEALHAWWTFSGICLALSIALMCSMLQGGWKTRLLVPLLILCSKPTFLAFCHGQNTFFSLLLLSATVWLWRKDLPLLAGVVCGFLFYKPQLGAVVAAVLCLSQGRRAILGVCMTGVFLALVNVLTMPGTLHEFLHQMPLNLKWIQEQNTYRWERHVTLEAFWRSVLQGDSIGPLSTATWTIWSLSEIALLTGVGAVLLRCRARSEAPVRRDALIAATIIAMPLLMPFYFDYDLLLISVGLVACAADRQQWATPRDDREDRRLLHLWTCLYVSMWFWFVVLIFWKTMYSPTVPLLMAAAALQIRGALRTSRPPLTAETIELRRHSLAA